MDVWDIWHGHWSWPHATCRSPCEGFRALYLWSARSIFSKMSLSKISTDLGCLLLISCQTQVVLQANCSTFFLHYSKLYGTSVHCWEAGWAGLWAIWAIQECSQISIFLEAKTPSTPPHQTPRSFAEYPWVLSSTFLKNSTLLKNQLFWRFCSLTCWFCCAEEQNWTWSPLACTILCTSGQSSFDLSILMDTQEYRLYAESEAGLQLCSWLSNANGPVKAYLPWEQHKS